MKRVELLAPCGNYETFIGALNAGADAVYFGGSKFGARAYADNFSEDEVIRAIRYAHLHSKKVYMTVNTLVKEREFDELIPFMKPYADEGLDGVIVQDLGVFKALQESFPKLPLHASTQMAVTGVYGAKLLKNMGAKRVVPARELSLKEIARIRKEADIEVEAFIHGAMCYSYSGMCLFSSLVGGRSGNRGRCAQPCRLSYDMKEAGIKDKYLLSLKDMCVIDMIPELIESGIDSFKIEGRMKSAEYSAGVTSIYRKYIDKYLEDPQKAFRVDSNDMDKLGKLYLRSSVSRGYYKLHNGKDMVTISLPGYKGQDESVLEEIRDKFLVGEQKLPVEISCSFYIDRPCSLTASCLDKTVYAEGFVVQEAGKRPMSKEDIVKNIEKLGGTFFYCSNCEIEIDSNPKGIFVPVKEINELRRKAMDILLLELLNR